MSPGKKTNRLVNEKRPYLLQHAYNPVDWYAWEDEAFGKAKKEFERYMKELREDTKRFKSNKWCYNKTAC